MDRSVELAIAADWSRKGAEMGYAPSMARYVGYLVKGQGTPINYESAREYAEKAAALAEPRAYIVMAGLYGSGMGVEKNPDLAKKMLENAAKRGSAEAMYMLGDCIYRAMRICRLTKTFPQPCIGWNREPKQEIQMP